MTEQLSWLRAVDANRPDAPRPVVAAGRVGANPPFAAKKGQPCPNRDSYGLCHTLPESNYDNNVATADPTIQGVAVPTTSLQVAGFTPVE